MMKRIIFAVLTILIANACEERKPFIVEGSVADTTLNGSKIYFVALDGPVSKNVDSAIIENGRFTFKAKPDSLCVKILRVPVRYPDFLEDLVVVTESGTMHALLSHNSMGAGTRLNNILQSWKNKKRTLDSAQVSLYAKKSEKGTGPEAADSLLKVSESLNKEYKDYVKGLMNGNIYNGVGLLLFKVYYNDLSSVEKQRILDLNGKIYSEKDAQLKLMISNDKNVIK